MSASLIDQLLNYPSAARVGLWLLIRDPGFFTAEEIADGIRALCLSRIQQTLRWMYAGGLVDRRIRSTNKPGPEPYEYKLIAPLIEELRRRNRS